MEERGTEGRKGEEGEGRRKVTNKKSFKNERDEVRRRRGRRKREERQREEKGKIERGKKQKKEGGNARNSIHSATLQDISHLPTSLYTLIHKRCWYVLINAFFTSLVPRLFLRAKWKLGWGLGTRIIFVLTQRCSSPQ